MQKKYPYFTVAALGLASLGCGGDAFVLDLVDAGAKDASPAAARYDFCNEIPPLAEFFENALFAGVYQDGESCGAAFHGMDARSFVRMSKSHFM